MAPHANPSSITGLTIRGSIENDPSIRLHAKPLLMKKSIKPVAFLSWWTHRVITI